MCSVIRQPWYIKYHHYNIHNNSNNSNNSTQYGNGSLPALFQTYRPLSLSIVSFWRSRFRQVSHRFDLTSRTWIPLPFNYLSSFLWDRPERKNKWVPALSQHHASVQPKYSSYIGPLPHKAGCALPACVIISILSYSPFCNGLLRTPSTSRFDDSATHLRLRLVFLSSSYLALDSDIGSAEDYGVYYVYVPVLYTL